MAVKGDGIFSNTDLFLCVTTEVLPCSNSGALETVAPYATAIAWCPRQTPKSGIFLSAQYLTNSTLIPAASGVPGPGEIKTPSYLAASLTLIASLRTTVHSAPSCCRY